MRYLVISLILSTAHVAISQGTFQVDREIEILRGKLYNNDSQGTNRVDDLNTLAGYYWLNRYDSGLYFSKKALLLSRQLDYRQGEVQALQLLSLSYNVMGDDVKSFDYANQALQLAKEVSSDSIIGIVETAYADNFSWDLDRALNGYRKALQLNTKSPLFQSLNLSQIALTLLRLNQPDSALIYARWAFEKVGGTADLIPFVPITLGMAYSATGNVEMAIKMFHLGSGMASAIMQHTNVAWANRELSKIYFHSASNIDSALHYAQLDLDEAKLSKSYLVLQDACQNLSEIYKNLNSYEEAYRYEALKNAYKDSLEILVRNQALADLKGFDLALKNAEQENTETQYRNRIMGVVLMAVFVLSIIIIYIVYRENRLQNKSKRKIESAYNQLKSTQSQLIHSEKMASLGELTAGIAHEIQNPLNFVNNFSEVNREMLHELKEAVAKNDQEEINGILKDLDENEEKITHHGKRAEGIVKSMLQHSRTGSDEKELTDINALCDEYLRLAYHGFRAKDKSFNADFRLDLDPTLPKVNVVPQDIGRVLLNLINNAFQAVSTFAEASADTVHKPLVTISTKGIPQPESSDRPLEKGESPIKGGKGGVTISITDNGPGIPDDIKDKIFEPFFTTKPTGEGTGLGLSMSYDIVTKGHGGTIEVESNDGEGSSFIIVLNTNL